MPGTRREVKTQRPGLYMHHGIEDLQASDKKLFVPKCSIVKYKKFVNLSDPQMGGWKDNISEILFNSLGMK